MKNVIAILANAKKKIKKKSRLNNLQINKVSQTTVKLSNIDMTIAELSAMVSTLNDPNKNVPEETIPAATTSFNKVISYLKKLDQIGTGIPDTLQGIPSGSDIQNIVNTGLIDNQLFVDSLCQLLRIQNPPRIIKQEETNE